MRAWRLTEPGGELALLDVPEPDVRPGAVLVRLRARPLLSYLGAYVAGELTSYRPPAGPFTPGTNAVGVVERVGPDVYGLAPGTRVFCSPHVVAGENVDEPAEALLALTAITTDPGPLDAWPDGTLADLVLVPAAAVTPVPAALSGIADATLAALSRCVVPYGGLLKGGLVAGERVVVHGATGAFGSAGVQVALAMGASVVVAAGRNRTVLDRLAGLPRVRTVRMAGEREADAAALRAAAGGGAHCALDLVGRAGSAEGTLAAYDALLRGGRLVLMGSMTVPLPLDYAATIRTGREVRGAFMYPRTAPARLLELVGSGQLDLGRIDVEEHDLADLPAAMERAAEPGAPLVVMT